MTQQTKEHPDFLTLQISITFHPNLSAFHQFIQTKLQVKLSFAPLTNLKNLTMKKLFYLTGVALLCSCGGDSTDGTGTTTDSTSTAETGTPVDNSIIDPLKDDLSGEIHAIDLINSMSVYYGKEIQLLVYPNTFAEGTTFSQDMACSAVSSEPYAYGQSKDVYINFTTVPTDVIEAGKPYLIKCKIDELGYFNQLTVVEASLVNLPADYKTEAFNPKAISATAIYNPADIINNINGWDKKTITVTGDYMGTTISKSYDQTELLDARVDIGTTDGKVGCSFATEEEAKVFEASQKNIKIKGELKAKLTFGSPSMENCVVVQ